MARARAQASRIVLAGGGTGGHLFPALALAAELRQRRPQAAIAFVGATRGLEARLVPQAGYPLLTLRLAGLKGASRPAQLAAAIAAAWAVARCGLWMLWRRPQLVVGVGGYASGPAVLAAIALRVRTMVLEQNHFPGATNRWLAPRVDAVCVPSEAAAHQLHGRIIVTGTPVRAEFAAIGPPPAGSRLSLLVVGGSRGARSINRAMVDALGALAGLASPPRIAHQTGREDEAEVRQAYAAQYPPELHEVRAFFDDMAQRLGQADLALCRAGASTLAELCAAGRPAILVPYPHAADDHQRHNAETLVQAGAAVLVADAALTGERLAAELHRLAEDAGRRQTMGRAARSLARPDATRLIGDVALRLLDGAQP